MASRIYFYSESLARTTTTTTDYSVSKTSITFTPNANKTYAIFWSVIVDHGTIGQKAQSRLRNTTANVTFCTHTDQATTTSVDTDKVSHGGVALYTDGGTPTAQTIALQVASSSSLASAGFQEASILVLELVANSDVWNSATANTSTSSTTYADKVALSWTPASTGSYLVFTSCAVQPSSTGAGWDPKARILINGTPLNIAETLRNESYTEFVAYRAAARLVSVSAAQTASLQFGAMNDGSANYIENAYIIALRISGFDKAFWAEDRISHSTTSATYADSASVTGTPDAVDYLILAAGMTTTNFEDQETATGQRISADGVSVGTNFTQTRGHDFYWWTWFSSRKITPSAISQTWKTQYARTAGTASAVSDEHVLAVLQLAASGATEKTITVSHDVAVISATMLITQHDAFVSDGSGPPTTISEHARQTNYNCLMILGPHEIDAWTNARLYYVADGETASTAYSMASRANVTSLSGSTGLNTLLLRIYDHQRHVFEWCRERRPDVGAVFPSLKQVAAVNGTREFNIYDVLKFTHSGASLTAQGCVNDVCDAHQIHQNFRQDYIPDPWAGSVPATTVISPYHYWKAAEEVRTTRAGASLADNTRPLLVTEAGQSFDSADGAVTTGRTDIYQLRRLKYGLMVLGPLYYGCCLVNLLAVARNAAAGYNTINVSTGLYYGDASPNRDADYAFAALDQREVSDDISFRAKSWTEYWKDWQVWFNQQQTPIAGGPSVCPFAEWNRVAITNVSVTMTAGGRNLIARKKNLRRGMHVFRAQVKLSAAGSQACLRVSGHDKLNGLALVSSTVLSGIQDWTQLSVQFFPRQHGNRRIPDPAVAVLMVDHNGVGTCEVRNPSISMGGEASPPPPVETYFDFQATDVTWSPINPAQGQAVTFSGTVKNIGDAPSPSGTILGIDFTVDGTTVASSNNITAGLAVNETRVQTANTGTWTAVGGQHTIAAIVDNANRFPTEKFRTNNTVSKQMTVSVPQGPQAPPPASAAGLNSLSFNDDFTSLSVYSPSNPDGTWRFIDFWQDVNQAGYVDFASVYTFDINQASTVSAIQPYKSASQLDSTTMRLTCRRARMNERPALRTVINDIAVNNQQQQPDQVRWLGAFMTTEKVHPFAPADITRPAYIECRMRFLPAYTQGIFSSFWLYDTSEVETPPSPEIDIFESNDHDPTFWKTNIHHEKGGQSFSLTHQQDWCDGNFHKFGMLWESSSIKIYYDDVLSGSLTGSNADFFSMPMRIMVTHTCDAAWSALTVPSNIENTYMDIDYIRVWKPGDAPVSTILTTGNSAEDLYDNQILQYCNQYGHPNPRIVKAQVKWESAFNVYAISSDTPCGIFSGWTSAESRSYGLLQMAPACGDSGDGRMLLTNGHPNLTTDTGSSLWSGSVYNPALNLDAGIKKITSGYSYFKSQFPTCPEINLVLMAAAGYAGPWSSVTGCGQWTSQVQIDYVDNVTRIYEEWWGQLPGTSGYDLVIDSISMSPANPTAGQAVTFSAVIRNAGTAATPSGIIHGVAFIVDGNGMEGKTWSDNVTASLLPGTTRTQTANSGVYSSTWTATSGSHTVIADVDDIDRMPNELDNTNNTRSLTFTVP